MEKSWKRIIPIDHSDSSSSDDSQDHLNSVWKHSLMSSKRVKMTTRLDGQGTSTSPPGFSAVLVSAYPNPSDVLMHHDYVGTSRSGLNSTNQTHDSAPQIRNIDNVPYLFYKLRDFYRGRHSSYLNNQTPANTTSWFDGDNREHVLNTQELTSLAVASLPGDIQYSITSTPHLPNSENRSSDENQDTNTSENTENNRNFQPPAPLPPPAITDEAESLPRESVLISPVKLEEQVSSCTASENASTSNTTTEQSDTPEKETKSTNTTIEKEEIDKNRETVAESKLVLNKDERDGSLNEMLLGLLECPVCWEVMPPPIYQCSRGHLLCRPCRKRLSTCPTCRATLNSSRNLAMEKVAEKLKYPCKNNGSGCSVMVVLREKREHEANCPHRLFTCLSPFCAPRWTCKLDTLVLHYENMHSEMLRRGPKHTLHIPVTHDFYRKLTSHVWVILAFEKLFMVSLRVVPPGEVFGCVQYVGPHSVSRKFIYELKTQLPLDIYRCVRFERTTHSDQSNIDRHYLKKDCFHLSDNWTKNFKSDDIPRSMDYLEIFVSVRPA